ncbi:hypothetical protein ACN20G_02885 [Streptomyces sp. BI20]|uniref:hypothetical protein n=1 Tax=Streptomyces sp. BI20 TaxID=3403460 RepID=UPI003C71B939
MDPAVVTAALLTAGTVGARVLFRWIAERAAVRRTELVQAGLSERVRALPAGSRLVERDGGRRVEIEVGRTTPPGIGAT